jgi:hypothetical protein
MKIQIEELKKITKTIDVDFPCYFKTTCGFMNEKTTGYIKLTETRKYAIEETEIDEGRETIFSFSDSVRDDFANSIFLDGKKITKEDYENIKKEALDCIKDF